MALVAAVAKLALFTVVAEMPLVYLFIYYIIFTKEYPISVQHCSPWGSCSA